MKEKSKIKFFNSIKVKVPLAIILAAILFSTALLLVSYHKSDVDIRHNVIAKFDLFEKMYHDKLLTKQNDLKLAMTIFLSNEKYKQLFADGNRDELLKELLPLYKNNLKKKYDIAQFQFHKPPAISFLRLHKPQKYGDDLSSFRQTVVDANKMKSVITGLEVGRGGPGLRIVYPIEKDGQHIGTVEFGAGFDNILRELSKTLGIEYTVGIKKSVFNKAKRFSNKKTDVLKDDFVFYKFSSESIKDFISELDKKN